MTDTTKAVLGEPQVVEEDEQFAVSADRPVAVTLIFGVKDLFEIHTAELSATIFDLVGPTVETSVGTLYLEQIQTEHTPLRFRIRQVTAEEAEEIRKQQAEEADVEV